MKLKEDEATWLDSIIITTRKETDKPKEELTEKPEVKEVLVVDTLLAKKEKKTYSTSSKNWKIKTVTRLVKKISQDKQLEEDVLSRLKKRAQQRSMEKQEEKTEDGYFNSYLSCFNCINGANL